MSDFAPTHKNIPPYPREVLLSLVETNAKELLGYSAGYPVMVWTSMGIRAHVAGRNLAKEVHVKAKWFAALQEREPWHSLVPSGERSRVLPLFV